MRYSTSSNFLRLLLIHILAVAPLWLTAQENAHLLSVDELFRLGTENSLQLKKSKLQEVIYNDQKKSAYTDRLPDIQVGASAGIIGQPVIFQRGLSHPVTQPLYQGGKIQAKIHQAELKKQIAALNSADNEAEIKLILLQQYMTLFSYYKQREVLARNIEESEHRLKDIRRMKKEGIVTRNDEIRSELQLTVARTQAIYTYYELQRTCGML